MKALVQRVSASWVVVDGAEVGRIGRGLLVLLGVARSDGEREALALASKVLAARLFPGPGGPWDVAVGEADGGLLVVSQFTLCASTRKGRRPSLDAAAPPEAAEPLYRRFVAAIAAAGVPVATGVFGATMAVHLVNEGPATFLYEAGPESP